MKKKLLSLLGIPLIIPMVFGQTKFSPTYAANDYSDKPIAGVVDPASYFDNAWEQTVGAKRISDRGVMITDKSHYGYRGWIKDRTFDMRNFNIRIDFSQMIPETAMTLTFGAEKAYYSVPEMVLSMDIVKSLKKPGNYEVTLNNRVGYHNESLPGFYDGKGGWPDNPQYAGVNVNAADGVIDISVKYLDSTSTKVSVNEVDRVVKTSDVYARFGGFYDQFLSIGMMNNDYKDQYYTIESVGDASDIVYFSNDGYFGKTKQISNELLGYDYTNPSKIIEAKEKFDSIPFDKLYEWDKNYLRKNYEQARDLILNAIEENAKQTAIPLFDKSVEKLENAVIDLTKESYIDEAISLYEDANARKDSIIYDLLSKDEKKEYDSVKNRLNVAYSKIPPAVVAIIESSIVHYENKVNSVKTSEDMKQVEILRTSIPLKYSAYITPDELQNYQNRIDKAEAKYIEKAKISNKNWVQGSGARVIENDKNEYQYVTYGSYSNEPETSNGLYYQEALDVLSFETLIRFDDIPSGSGKWFTMGLMEHPNMWVNANDDSVQNNKGIFFLINRISPVKIGVQGFICTLTSTTFYDSVINEILEVTPNKDIHVKFYTEEATIDGKTDTYFRMTFDGKGFEEDITVKHIKTALGKDLKGHLIMASNGCGQHEPCVITLKSINGKAPNSENIAPQENKTPIAKESEKTYKIGTNKSMTFDVNTFGLEPKEVLIDNQIVDPSNYKFNMIANKLTFTKEFMATLTAKDYKVTLKTEGGVVTWTLHVVSDSGEVTPPQPDTSEPEPNQPSTSETDTPIIPDDKPNNDINLGAVIGGCIGGTIGVIALLGGLFFLIRHIIKKRKVN